VWATSPTAAFWTARQVAAFDGPTYSQLVHAARLRRGHDRVERLRMRVGVAEDGYDHVINA
jgi:hypothetical protein